MPRDSRLSPASAVTGVNGMAAGTGGSDWNQAAVRQ